MEKRLFAATENAEQKVLRLRVETVRGNLQGVKEALAQGVSVDQPFRAGDWNALMHASSMGHQHIVQYLLEEGADPNFHKELFTPLMAACASNNDCEEKLLSCVKHLLRFRANVNATERHRLTPLMFTCKQGHVKIARELLANDVDLNAQDSQGWTALFWAVSKGNIAIVELLIAGGADKEEKDRSGGTVLRLATRKSYHEIEAIIQFGLHGHFLDPKSDSSSRAVEDDNSNYTNSLNRMCDTQSVVPNNLFNKEISKHLASDACAFEEIGLKYSWPKRDTLELIGELRCKPCNKSDTESLSYTTAIKILAELVTQISNTHTAIAILRHKFQNVPLDLPQDNRWAGSARLRCITRFVYNRAEKLFLEAKYLQEYVVEMSRPISELMPSEETEEVVEEHPQTEEKSSVLTTIVVASACFIVIMWNTKVIRSFTLFNF